MTLEEFRNKYTSRTYLGDGLYAAFDGYHIILYAERENGEHHVGLESYVFDELIKYRKQIYEDSKKVFDE